MRNLAYALFTVFLLGAVPSGGAAQAAVESHVVVGMYSGLALLMDVHVPASPNGLGVALIQGSSWQRPLAYDAPLLTDGRLVAGLGRTLVDAGYTVFALNHRAAPRFTFPAPLEDVQRAVRYIRYHADEYGVDPDRIGAVGNSSGGHLAHLLGTLDGDGDPDDPDPVNRVSAKVQAVVAWYAPVDLASVDTSLGIAALAQMLGSSLPFARGGSRYIESRLYRDASPLTFVSSDDPPTLLIHGDADDVVPIEQSEMMQAALREAGVAAQLIRVPGGGHGPLMERAISIQELADASLKWLDQHLRSQ